MKLNHKGFTIVELLIVIVVIGILAAIVIVAYNGVTARANDTKVRNAAAQLEKSIFAWSIETGNTVIHGGLNSTTAVGSTGCVDGVSGWFGKGAYVCTAEEHLIAQKVIPANFTSSLPSNKHYSPASGGRLAMMLYKCGATAGRYALFWTLERPTSEESAALDSIVGSCGNTQVRDTWGMRAGKIIQLNP